jgi:hypothetical protein
MCSVRPAEDGTQLIVGKALPANEIRIDREGVALSAAAASDNVYLGLK